MIKTDFPDIWSKVAIRTEGGSVLCIPRERNMTRLYIELSSKDGDLVPKSVANQEYVMKKARELMHPYKLEWESVGELLSSVSVTTVERSILICFNQSGSEIILSARESLLVSLMQTIRCLLLEM